MEQSIALLMFLLSIAGTCVASEPQQPTEVIVFTSGLTIVGNPSGR